MSQWSHGAGEDAQGPAASLRAGAAPERGDVAVAAQEATAVALSCLLYSQGLFLGWREAAL